MINEDPNKKIQQIPMMEYIYKNEIIEKYIVQLKTKATINI